MPVGNIIGTQNQIVTKKIYIKIIYSLKIGSAITVNNLYKNNVKTALQNNLNILVYSIAHMKCLRSVLIGNRTMNLVPTHSVLSMIVFTVCLIVGCGDLTILLLGLGFHCFLFRKRKTASQPWQAIAQRFCSIWF